MRTGIPLGQLRSFVGGRAVRSTTLQSIASVMGMRLFIAQGERGGMGAPPLPTELTRALDLPSDASVVEAVDVRGSPGFTPRPSLSATDDDVGRNTPEWVAGVHAPAFVERNVGGTIARAFESGGRRGSRPGLR